MMSGSWNLFGAKLFLVFCILLGVYPVFILVPNTPIGDISVLSPGTFYLTKVDEKHRRFYERVPLSGASGKNGATIKVLLFSFILQLLMWKIAGLIVIN